MEAGLTSMHHDHMADMLLHALCVTRFDFTCEHWDQWPERETADYRLSLIKAKLAM